MMVDGSGTSALHVAWKGLKFLGPSGGVHSSGEKMVSVLEE